MDRTNTGGENMIIHDMNRIKLSIIQNCEDCFFMDEDREYNHICNKTGGRPLPDGHDEVTPEWCPLPDVPDDFLLPIKDDSDESATVETD
jgi:hypothetical protein